MLFSPFSSSSILIASFIKVYKHIVHFVKLWVGTIFKFHLFHLNCPAVIYLKKVRSKMCLIFFFLHWLLNIWNFRCIRKLCLQLIRYIAMLIMRKILADIEKKILRSNSYGYLAIFLRCSKPLHQSSDYKREHCKNVAIYRCQFVQWTFTYCWSRYSYSDKIYSVCLFCMFIFWLIQIPLMMCWYSYPYMITLQKYRSSVETISLLQWATLCVAIHNP